jgi:mono/diheme cytochrome c family protein
MHRTALASVAITTALLIFANVACLAEPLTPSAQRGKVFVQTNCARCHAVGSIGDSPLAIAPPFRTLHQRYPVETLEEALAEGIVTGHPTMPEFRLDPDQIDGVIAYFKTLE